MLNLLRSRNGIDLLSPLSRYETLPRMDQVRSKTPIAVTRDIRLSSYNTWQVGGPADYFCLPKTIEEVTQAWKWAQGQDLDVHILGGGSNVLISDQGIRGLVLCLKNLVGVDQRVENGRLHLEVLAGTSKSELLKIFLKNQLAPALFLAGIPGDTGGGVVMNAGVSESMVPREFTEIVDWFEVLKPDGRIHRYNHDDVRWNYRHCEGWQPGIVVRVAMSWPCEPDPDVLMRVREANRIRLTKQPLDMPSCGSVFVNPPGLKAAQLIDRQGLKGFQIGQAQVSMKHANFIVNLGGAKAQDIWQVIQHVKRVVKAQEGVDLKTEVVLMGEWIDAAEGLA